MKRKPPKTIGWKFRRSQTTELDGDDLYSPRSSIADEQSYNYITMNLEYLIEQTIFFFQFLYISDESSATGFFSSSINNIISNSFSS